MSDENHPHLRPALQVGSIPWLFFLFLAAVFFLNYHDLSWSMKGADNYNPSANAIIADSTTGSLVHLITKLSLGIVAIASLVFDRNNRRFRVNGSVGWIALIFVAWAYLSLIWAADFLFTFKKLVILGLLCITALAVARRFSLREIILWTFFSSALFLCIGVCAEVLFGTFRPFASGYRFAGSLGPNGQGIDCGLLLLSAVAASDIEKRWRALFWTFVLVGFVFLILTGSRTACSAVLLSLIAYWTAVSSRTTKIATALSVLLISSFLLLCTGTGLLPHLKGAILLGRQDLDKVDTLDSRTIIWEDVGDYIRQRPMLGYGYSGFWTPSHISEISDKLQAGIVGSHSTYIECLLTLGAGGLIVYTLLLFAGTRCAFRFHRLSGNKAFAFVGAFLVFYALEGLLESSLTDGGDAMFLWMVILARLAFVPPVPSSADCHISFADLQKPAAYCLHRTLSEKHSQTHNLRSNAD